MTYLLGECSHRDAAEEGIERAEEEGMQRAEEEEGVQRLSSACSR